MPCHEAGHVQLRSLKYRWCWIGSISGATRQSALCSELGFKMLQGRHASSFHVGTAALDAFHSFQIVHTMDVFVSVEYFPEFRMKLYVSRDQSVFRMRQRQDDEAATVVLDAWQDPERRAEAMPTNKPEGRALYANLCFSILRSPIIMFRSLAIRAGLLCLALAPLATVASAQLKIAVVNVQKAMLDSDELKKVSAEVEAKYKPKQDELLKLQNDLQSIQQQLQSNKLTPQAQADLQLQGQRKQRDAQRLSDDLQQEFDRDRQDILGKSAQKMTDVVKKLAEEKGFDMVVDVSQALYFKPTMDVTADALAAYNKAYPAK
jgi:outer membrane protein